jgi:hypothetical protein
VAVLGSVLAQAYRSRLSPHLAGLPAPARGAALSSISGAHAVAARLGAGGQPLISFGDAAFVHAMQITTLISAVIVLLGLAAALAWMPRRAAPATAAPGTAPRPPEGQLADPGLRAQLQAVTEELTQTAASHRHAA